MPVYVQSYLDDIKPVSFLAEAPVYLHSYIHRHVPVGTMADIFEERRDLLKYIRFAMRLAAMYPLHLKCLLPRPICGFGHFIEWAIEVFLYLVCVHIAILYVCTMYVNYHSGDLEMFVNCLMQTLIYIWTITMKIYFRRLRPHLLQELVESINFGYRTRSDTGNMLQAQRLLFHILLYFLFGLILFLKDSRT